MIITAIKPFERGKNRVAVYLNDEFAFVLYRGELSKYSLKEGNEINDDSLKLIMDETLLKRAKKRGMNLLQKMDRTEADIRRKLKEGGYPDVVVDETIEFLKSYRYIDDRRYADSYIRFKLSSMSRREISKKLMEKGISESLIEEQFCNFFDENNEDEEETELSLCKKLLLKKCSTLDLKEYDNRMKVFSYLYRKGFRSEIIDKAFKDLT